MYHPMPRPHEHVLKLKRQCGAYACIIDGCNYHPDAVRCFCGYDETTHATSAPANG